MLYFWRLDAMLYFLHFYVKKTYDTSIGNNGKEKLLSHLLFTTSLNPNENNELILKYILRDSKVSNSDCSV